MNMHNIYLFLGIFGTTVLAIQFVLGMLSGGDGGGDADIELGDGGHDVADLHGLNIFSLKSIVSFVTFFGWGGFFFGGESRIVGVTVAAVCGLVMMLITALVISLLLKMQQSGNLDMEALPGCRGKVYLATPGDRAAGGVVTVILPGCTRQFPARSDEPLPTGTDVTVKAVLGGGVLLVERASGEAAEGVKKQEL